MIDYLGEADEIIGKIDKDDVPFVALALAIENDGIWTEIVKLFENEENDGDGN